MHFGEQLLRTRHCIRNHRQTSWRTSFLSFGEGKKQLGTSCSSTTTARTDLVSKVLPLQSEMLEVPPKRDSAFAFGLGVVPRLRKKFFFPTKHCFDILLGITCHYINLCKWHIVGWAGSRWGFFYSSTLPATVSRSWANGWMDRRVQFREESILQRHPGNFHAALDERNCLWMKKPCLGGFPHNQSSATKEMSKEVLLLFFVCH